MASQLKSETSRLNGARSRGPVTSAGLEKSSQNARKHGGASSRPILLPCESSDEYRELHETYKSTYKPDGDDETALVAEMAESRWRMIRLDGIETDMLIAEMSRLKSKPARAGAAKLLTRAFCSLADKSKGLALAGRYQSREHRIHDRLYKTLRELQRTRSSQESEYPSNMTVSWITPDERKARDDADRQARIAIAQAQGKLPNEPTVAASNEVTDLEPAPKPILVPPPHPKSKMQR
jgi:hypothetical protein